MFAGEFDVVVAVFANPFEVGVFDGADDFAGDAHDDGAVGDDGAGAEDGTGADDAFFADDAVAEEDGFHSYQRATADFRAVDDGAVADGDVGADVEGFAGVAVEDAVFLDIGSLANANRCNIAADNGLEPEGAVVTDGDVGADDGVGGLVVVGDAFDAGVGAEGGHGILRGGEGANELQPAVASPRGSRNG